MLAYYYIDFNDASSMSVGTLLRSLIKQICATMEDIPKEVQSFCSQHRASGQAPSTAALISLLRTLERDLHLEMYIIIDALDEFSEDRKSELLQTIASLASRQFLKSHVLVASRSEDYIEESISQFLTEDIKIDNALVDIDISLFIQSSLSEDARLKKLPAHIKELAQEKLAEGAQGMYVFSKFSNSLASKKPASKQSEQATE